VPAGQPCPHCAGVAAERKRQIDRARGTAASRGYDARWQKYRAAFLREHPLCECPDCQAGRLRVRAASVVDHIIPHRGDPVLFWDPANHQAMAADCHRSKTAREDGGFGNPRRSA